MIHAGSLCINTISATGLYHLLVAVYLFYVYFENKCILIRLYENKLYICI